MADITSLKKQYNELITQAKEIQKQIKEFNKSNPKIIIASPSSDEFKKAIESQGPSLYNWKTQIINTGYDYYYWDNWAEHTYAAITIRSSIKNDNIKADNFYQVLSYIRIDNSGWGSVIVNYTDKKYISKSKTNHEIASLVDNHTGGPQIHIYSILSLGPMILYQE